MRYVFKHKLMTIAGSAVTVALLTTFIMAQNRRQDTAMAPSEAREEPDRSEWILTDQTDAIDQALNILGLPVEADGRVAPEIVSLAEDNTPFLTEQILDRPLWHVVIQDWQLLLASAPAAIEDQYTRTFDAYLNPVDGRLVKIVSRWPDDVARIPPEPEASIYAEQMLRSGNETYFGFPDGNPSVTFLDALDAVIRGHGNPFAAAQIIGQYVEWSRMDQDPRPVWAITLRGIPPFAAAYPGVSIHARNHLRHIVDAETGEWLCASTTPQPVDGVPEP